MTRILFLAASLGLAVSGAQACDFMKSAAKVDTDDDGQRLHARDADAADVDSGDRRHGRSCAGRRGRHPAIRVGSLGQLAVLPSEYQRLPLGGRFVLHETDRLLAR